jgi:hypothetical protein
MLLTAYALSPAAVYADPPLFCLGPCTSFHINSAFEERYEENIFRDPSNEKEDYASILSPGAYLQFGNHESANSGTLFFREDFFFYAKNSKLDHEEANVFFSWQSCFARSNFNLDASYIER